MISTRTKGRLEKAHHDRAKSIENYTNPPFQNLKARMAAAGNAAPIARLIHMATAIRAANRKPEKETA